MTTEAMAPPPGFTQLDERVYGAARLVFLRREQADQSCHLVSPETAPTAVVLIIWLSLMLP